MAKQTLKGQVMSKNGFWFILFLYAVSVTGCIGQLIVLTVRYDVEIEGHLKRAADANTVPMALSELRIAVANIEKQHLTHGSSHVLYASPSTDLKFWYNNLQASITELERVTPETSQLETSNILVKLRETLLDHHEKGDSVTSPENITVYPNQFGYMIVEWCLGLLGVCLLFCFIALFKDS